MEWSASDQTQMHGHEVSKKRSFDLSQSYPGHLTAVLGHHHEVKCTVRFSNCEPVDKNDDDRKHSARREVPCASPPVNEDSEDREHPARREVPCTSPSVDEDNEDRKHPTRREVPCAMKTAEEMQTDYPVRRDKRFRHGYIPYKIDESRLAWSCTIDSHISLAYSAREDDPTLLVADIFPAHKGWGMRR
jgi:hypothetical protein